MTKRSGIWPWGVLAGGGVALAAGAGIYFALGGPGPLHREIAPPDETPALRRTDPALIGYLEQPAIPTGLADPRGLAVGPDGRICVVGDREVRVFEPGGSAIRRFDTAGAGTCVAVGPDGKVYVGSGATVEVFDAEGRPLAVWAGVQAVDANGQPSGPVRHPFGEKATISSIAAGAEELYLADERSSSVLRCDRQGRLLARIGQADAAAGVPGILLRSPHFDVALGPDGRLWVANPGRHRVESYTPQGRPGPAWGRPGQTVEGFSGCCNPKDLAVLPDGRFVTSEKGFPRVKVYDSSGRLVCVVAGPESLAEAVEYLDVAADAAGRVLVLDRQARSVRVFVPKPPAERRGSKPQ